MTHIDQLPDKDPGSKLDYVFDFASLLNHSGPSNWLDAGEYIINPVEIVSVPSGLTIEDVSITNSGTSITYWLSNGVLNEKYRISCKIKTTANREVVKSAYLTIRPTG